MKLSVSKRILMFFHWLLSLMICAALAIFAFAPDFASRCAERLGDSLGRTGSWIAGIALLAIYLALAVFQICLILNRQRREDRGFISVDTSDSGKIRIAISAVEQMVRQSVHSIDGIAEMNIGIDSLDDAIVIDVNAVIQNGSHVPTITMNMQRAIRQFVEVNCGVAVREVSISINAVANQQESAHRRFLGRVRPGNAKAEPPAPHKQAPVDEAAASTEAAPEAKKVSGISQETGFAGQDAGIAEAPADAAGDDGRAPAEAGFPGSAEEPEPYDFDKPYESDFAKDLAAMKAREAAQADGGLAPEDE